MTKMKDYMGGKKIIINGEEIVAIIVSSNPDEIPGEKFEITADYGEGSFGDIYIKLLKKFTK